MRYYVMRSTRQADLWQVRADGLAPVEFLTEALALEYAQSSASQFALRQRGTAVIMRELQTGWIEHGRFMWPAVLQGRT